MDNFKKLEKYTREVSENLVISDETINLHESFLLVNIFPQKEVTLKRMETQVIDTKLFIAGPSYLLYTK